ncbi:tetratricopeptide repeat protein 14 isoform X2 [Parasteatoda tepidariorum]|uniref:tetratricopeptide repeat protein 14 isoform X2 n=1 Tax=Parasteatoda tepidariorum TaxID=114398 RepID=UPI001C726B40|nr:tetratricopeptide repeat protein 14 isoform X2 [Parasteatoda tepidariorum]
MDQYLWLKSLHSHGPSLINSVVNDAVIDSQNLSKKQKIFNFIKNKHEILFQERPAAFQKSPSFDPLPVELFWDCSKEQRRKLFFKHLERGDVLLLKVINDGLSDNYKLLVLAKHQCCMKLDDLSLVMYLPKLKQELDLVAGGVINYDVIRAAVCSCSLHERKLFVTLDDTILDEDAEPVKLGKITTDELPSYLGKQCPAAETGKVIKMKHIMWLSDMHYNKAVEYYQAQNFTQAILCLNQSLAIYPQNKKALVSRGTLYFKTNNLNKAFIDTDQAMQLDPLYEPAQKQMSVLLVDVAKEHKKTNKFALAKEALRMAIHLNDLNEEAKQLLLKIEEEEEEIECLKSNKISLIPTIVNGSPTKTHKPSPTKKKRRRHRSRREEYERRKQLRHKSKSGSPKRKKSLQSVINKVVAP